MQWLTVNIQKADNHKIISLFGAQNKSIIISLVSGKYLISLLLKNLTQRCKPQFPREKA